MQTYANTSWYQFCLRLLLYVPPHTDLLHCSDILWITLDTTNVFLNVTGQKGTKP